MYIMLWKIMVRYLLCVIDQACGQDGWILAKFFFVFLLTKMNRGQYSVHLDQINLDNK